MEWRLERISAPGAAPGQARHKPPAAGQGANSDPRAGLRSRIGASEANVCLRTVSPYYSEMGNFDGVLRGHLR